MSISPTIARGAGPLFGRDQELAVIEQWATLARGSARTGLLVGPQGVGKSSILAVATDRRRRAGDRVLEASCAIGGGVPYLPLVTALAPLLERATEVHRPDL